MFAIRLRVSPCSARCSPRSVGRATVRTPSSTLISISRLSSWVSSPFGPFTVTRPGATSTVTPAGISIGLFPILLMKVSLVRLPDVGDHFAADALLLGLVAGHHAGRGRNDRSAHAAL